MKKSIKLLGATAIFAAIIPISAYAATISSPTPSPTAPTSAVTAPAAVQDQDTTNFEDTTTTDATEAPEVKGAPEAAGAAEAKGAPEAVDPNEQAKLQQAATLTGQQATDIALKKVSGTVKSVELEDNNGTVVYGVQIVDANGKALDVKVDAKTGAVLQADNGGSEN